ncbi:pancreatic secretory granule membrane major glycoprotein GP2, partial [Austrofundulus limnaeus]|uniref:Pancreatic secretory granule membrane major glycoprotein GP2 n=1 Tax=Austrofundulus limnaeus TaxID=52670 RepID=A0A2I4DD02_AUSLI
KCQFLTAYAKACSLYSNTELDEWRSKTNCYHHEAFCHNKTCNDHEFCAEALSGDYQCFCRAKFACEVRNNYAYGHPPVCVKNHASLTLYNCLLVENNIDYKVLHLNDPACRGQLDTNNNMVTFNFEVDTCGTQISDNGTHIIYENTVTNQNITDVIIRHDMVRINFSCYQTQPDLLTTTFTVMNSDYKGVIVPGLWTYTLYMKAY